LDNISFYWDGTETLDVRFTVYVHYRYRSPVQVYEGKTVLPSRAAAESDIFSVASQVAPCLFEHFRRLEECVFVQTVGGSTMHRLRVPRCMAEGLGADARKYSANVTRVWSQARSTAGREALVLGVNQYLMEKRGWK
jgi:hypothetical protein